MFGSKQDKAARLAHIVELLADEGLSQADLARRMRVERSTIASDLVDLEAHGVLLQEEAGGKVSLFRS